MKHKACGEPAARNCEPMIALRLFSSHMRIRSEGVIFGFPRLRYWARTQITFLPSAPIVAWYKLRNQFSSVQVHPATRLCYAIVDHYSGRARCSR